jgi:outer membrane protein assembly complex protein YaeT
MRATDRFHTPARLGAVFLAGLLLSAGAAPAQSSLPPIPPPLNYTPSSKAIVSDVKVIGLRNVAVDQVTALTKVRAGATFSQSAVNDDYRVLAESGLFSQVALRIVPQSKPDLVEIDFVVSEWIGRVREIEYRGAKHFDTKELDETTGLKRGEPLIPYKNQRACQLILEKYYEQGRPLATVRLLEGGKQTDTRVVFDITEGPKVKIRAIECTGVTFVSVPVLKTHLKSSPEYFGFISGKFNPLVADYDVTTLEEYYRSYGYLDVKVAREMRWVDDNHVDLVFHVHEGVRYTVGARPQVSGAGKEIPRETIESIPHVKEGKPYSDPEVKRDATAISDYYGGTGRDAKVKPVVYFPPDGPPGTCTVQYDVVEHPPAKVGIIYIVGNEVTRDHVIQRQFPDGMMPGQTLSYPDLRLAERNLSKLGIFEVNQETDTRPHIDVIDRENDPIYKDLVVRVNETRTGSILLGAGLSSDLGVTGSIVLNERNFDITRVPTSLDDLLAMRAFRGAGQELRLEAVPGTETSRYGATWREPFLFDSQYSLTVGGYYWQRLDDGYTESRTGMRVTVGRKLDDLWTLSFGGRIENIGVNNILGDAPETITSVEGNNFLVAPRVGVTRDTRDSYLRPTEGNLLDLSAEYALGEFQFPILSASFSQYWTLYQRADNSGRHVLAYHGTFGWEGAQAPVYERFYAGGFGSLRGFAYRGVSPDENGYKVGGDFMFLNSLEYQMPVLANDHVYLVAFVDSGTVESRLDFKDYRVAAGVGIRFVVPMLGPVPIAVDFGFPIVKAATDHTQLVSFSIGVFH